MAEQRGSLKLAFAALVAVSAALPDGAMAASQVFEKGNALYRPLNAVGKGISFGHAGIYLNSNSNYTATKAQFLSGSIPPIMNSNGFRSVIHAPGQIGPLGNGVSIAPFSAFLGNQPFWGAYDYPTPPSAAKRQAIIISAGQQLNNGYAFTSEWDGHTGFFRCDGLIAFAYASANLPIPIQGSGEWFKNYPRTQRNQLTLMASASAPTCGAASAATVSGGVQLSINADDGPNGSGVDRVEFYNGFPGLAGTLLGTDDHDSDPEVNPRDSPTYSIIASADPGANLFGVFSVLSG